MALPITSLSILRSATGIALLTVPELTGSLFLVHLSSTGLLAARMAGARDLGMGALLWASHRASLRGRGEGQGVGALAGREERSPILKSGSTLDSREVLGKASMSNENRGIENRLRGTGTANGELLRVLWAGIAVDALDLASVLWLYLDGTLNSGGALTIGGAALFLLGLDGWAVRMVRV